MNATQEYITCYQIKYLFRNKFIQKCITNMKILVISPQDVMSPFTFPATLPHTSGIVSFKKQIASLWGMGLTLGIPALKVYQFIALLWDLVIRWESLLLKKKFLMIAIKRSVGRTLWTITLEPPCKVLSCT